MKESVRGTQTCGYSAIKAKFPLWMYPKNHVLTFRMNLIISESILQAEEQHHLKRLENIIDYYLSVLFM